MERLKAGWAVVGPTVKKSARLLWSWIRAVRWSVMACVVTLFLGLFGMGILGILLWYPVAPVLWLLRFPGPDAWQGDWVWPAVIGAGMAWALGFLLAGEVNRRLVNRGVPTKPRRGIYLGVLWSWDLVVWFLILYGKFRG